MRSCYLLASLWLTVPSSRRLPLPQPFVRATFESNAIRNVLGIGDDLEGMPGA